ncbi:MAG: hypothetical protein HDR56_01645 [Treponema sp.]|nr:hypothetical protein [Treponema sp.]
MNGKKNVFFICASFCALLPAVLSGCGTTRGLVDDRAELVWANAELYGRVRGSVERLQDCNREIEQRCRQFEQGNREFGDTIESLRSAIEGYIELCRFAVEATRRQGEEIKRLQEIVGGGGGDDNSEQIGTRGSCDSLSEVEN